MAPLAVRLQATRSTPRRPAPAGGNYANSGALGLLGSLVPAGSVPDQLLDHLPAGVGVLARPGRPVDAVGGQPAGLGLLHRRLAAFAAGTGAGFPDPYDEWAGGLAVLSVQAVDEWIR